MNITKLQKLLKREKGKRPILECLRIEPERRYATNSYSIVLEELKSEVDKPININVFNGSVDPHNYPSLDKIINNSQYMTRPVESMLITQGEDDKLVYEINGTKHFYKELVDMSMAVFGIKAPYNCEHFRTNGLTLTYRFGGKFVLILGLRRAKDLEDN